MSLGTKHEILPNRDSSFYSFVVKGCTANIGTYSNLIISNFVCFLAEGPAPYVLHLILHFYFNFHPLNAFSCAENVSTSCMFRVRFSNASITENKKLELSLLLITFNNCVK